MTYTREGEKITLEMTVEDYDRLTLMLGYAAGSARMESQHILFWRYVQFTNELNRTNPNYQPYKIPEEFRAKT